MQGDKKISGMCREAARTQVMCQHDNQNYKGKKKITIITKRRKQILFYDSEACIMDNLYFPM